jgi:hypothetical protein
MWDNGSLDATFRGYWTSASYTQYEPLQDGKAEPNAPGPYCVYEIGEPARGDGMSGATSTTRKEELRFPVQFRIHAKSSTAKSGKQICAELAAAIAAVFDPPSVLAIDTDSHIQTHREGDVLVREGDDEWSLVLRYDFVLDATYNTVS